MSIFVGKVCGKHPEDPFEAWINDAWIQDYNDEILPKLNAPSFLIHAVGERDEKIMEKKDRTFNETLPFWMPKIEAQIGDS